MTHLKDRHQSGNMKILVSGPQFHGYTRSIADGFEKLGHEVSVSHTPGFHSNVFDQAMKFLLRRYERLTTNDEYYMFKKAREYRHWRKRDEIERYNRNLFDRVKREGFDIFLALKGELILPKTVRKIQKVDDVISIIWCYDKATRYPNIVKASNYYDFFYTFEPSDIDELKERNVDASYLPMAYDPSYYHRRNDTSESFDISFVGRMYPKRRSVLNKLSQELEDLNIGIWGKAWTWYNPFAQYEYKVNRRELGNNINNYNVSHDKINWIYNSSKICLNLHSTQSKEGLNPRTFEILGSGGFELVDYKSGIERSLEIDEELVSYTDLDDLIEKIGYYLENPGERRRISQKGYEKAVKHHTYKDRAESVLETIEKAKIPSSV